MRAIFSVILLAVLTVGIAFAQQSGDAVVAEVNGIKIAVADVIAEMNRLTPEVQQQVIQDPNGKSELVNSIIQRKLLVTEAKTFQIDTISAVKALVDRAAEDIYVQVLINTIQQQNYQVTEEEVQIFYNENDSIFDLPTRYNIAQIVFPDKDIAEDILGKLRKEKMSWDDAAAKYTAAGDARTGEAGWLFETQIVPEALAEIKKLKDNEYTSVIDIQGVFYVVKLLASEPPRKQSFEESKERIAQFLSQNKAQSAVSDYQNKLQMQAKISIDNAVLNSINLGGTPTPTPQGQ